MDEASQRIRWIKARNLVLIVGNNAELSDVRFKERRGAGLAKRLASKRARATPR